MARKLPVHPDAERERLIDRRFGAERPGRVTVRDFDQGMVETLGACIFEELPPPENQRYFLNLDGIDPPPGRPGVLVTFSFPEAEFKGYVIPLILFRRDDIAPANERWHSVGHESYRTPAEGASNVVLPDTLPANLAGAKGVDRIEVGLAPIPFDFTYTISILTHYRGAPGQRGQVNRILQHVLRVFPPFGKVIVRDSIGDLRGYHTFTEATSVLDEHPEIAERIIGFGVTVRVEAELDLAEPTTHRTVTQPLTLNLKQL